MKTTKIVTHNGTFHADDVLAVATLAHNLGSDIEIVRTRDPKIIDDADIVVDVGGKYDGQKYFDHHQDQNLPASNMLIVKDGKFDRIPHLAHVYEGVSDWDTGRVNSFDELPESVRIFIKWVQACNPLDLSESDKMFRYCVSAILQHTEDFYDVIIADIDTLNAKKADVVAEHRKRAAAFAENNAEIAVFPEYLHGWHEELNREKAPSARWVVFPDPVQNNFTIQVVPNSADDRSFPEEDDLNNWVDANHPDTVFIHKAGFIAKVKEFPTEAFDV